MKKRAAAFLRSLTKPERSALAERCGIKPTSLNNIIYGKAPSPRLACLIEKQTKMAVTRRDLLPDYDWDLVSGTLTERMLESTSVN